MASRPRRLLETLEKAWRARGTHLSAPQVFVLSFFGLIAFGSLGLLVLPGLYTGPRLGRVDAIFTATSAVCLTGLTVVDTPTYFTPVGQAFILLLIQLGGIGFITFTSLLILLIGQRLSVRQEILWRSSASRAIDYRRLVHGTVFLTIGFEFLGAVALLLMWGPKLGWENAWWHALFHSVSAFCNAGFSTFSDSLIGHRGSSIVLIIIMVLIVAGGLGFAVLEDIAQNLRTLIQRKRGRLTLNTKLVFWVTALLIFGGAAGFLVFESRGVLAPMGPGERLVNAFFMSVTARTAGFNTIDYGQVSDRTGFLTILLMAVGGSPGSMAGGIKTTTVALLGILAWSRLRGSRSIAVFNRSVSEENMQRAVGLFVLAFGITTAGLLLMTTTELTQPAERRFLRAMFEVVSAFNTVGLSMNMTPELSREGRLLAILLMFIGRVGPLAFSAALMARLHRGVMIRLAAEDVSVG